MRSASIACCDWSGVGVALLLGGDEVVAGAAVARSFTGEVAEGVGAVVCGTEVSLQLTSSNVAASKPWSVRPRGRARGTCLVSNRFIVIGGLTAWHQLAPAPHISTGGGVRLP
jgi:hypothetical protein